MIICGLDIATRTGCAVIGPEGLIHGEAHRPRGDTDAEIFHGFRIWLRPLLISFGVRHVGIEEPLRSDLTRKNEKTGQSEPISQMKTFIRLYGLFGHAIEICRSMNLDFDVINQSTWRKEFIGNGRADKDDAVAKCKEMGWEVKSKDVAEACGVAWVTRSWLFPELAAKPGDLFQVKQGAEPALEQR